MLTQFDPGDRLLTPAEVAALFRVDAKTVSRWGSCGRLPSIRTPGAHRRFREADVRAALAGEGSAGDPLADSLVDLGAELGRLADMLGTEHTDHQVAEIVLRCSACVAATINDLLVRHGLRGGEDQENGDHG